MRESFFAFAIFLAVTGCNVGPRYVPPTCRTVEEWKGQVQSDCLPQVEHWWDVFEDEELVKLEKLAVEKNLDLYVAIQRVAESRAVAGVARSYLYPSADLKPVFNNVQELIELYGVPQGLFPSLKTITRVREQLYSLPATMWYEVDLWGKYRGTYQAAKIYAESLEEAVQALYISVTTNVAGNYFNLRALDAQIALLDKTLIIEKEKVRLTRLRFEKGLVPAVDLYHVEEELANLEAEYEESVRQRIPFIDALAVLVGENASLWCFSVLPLEKEPPPIPAGLPSELLMRRPDVAQAEKAMASIHSLIGVAYATYFPNIKLTSTLGFLSPEFSRWMTWSGRLWQIGSNITQVLFNVGRNSSYVAAARAKFEEAKGLYEKTVLVAFSEVEDALSDMEQQKRESDAYNQGWKSAQQIEALSSMRYEKGIINVFDVLTAKKNAFDAERKWINVVGQRYQSSLELIKAIGGKWEAPCEKSPCCPCEEEKALSEAVAEEVTSDR
ncbi:MAG TPA: efflux transporter outer membrane subunit [Chlamydiales bacterium]|nr:efflux transporter outer membrane subunit [Chlamydiales bacterium]